MPGIGCGVELSCWRRCSKPAGVIDLGDKWMRNLEPNPDDGDRDRLRLLQRILKSERVPVLVLDWSLRVVGATDGAEFLLKKHGRGAGRAEVLLEAVRQACERGREEWHEVLLAVERPGRILESRVGLTDELTAVVLTQSPGDRELGRPTFRVTLLPAERNSLESRLAWLALLGPAEVEVVERLCLGWTNQQVADSRGRSVATVKSELSRIFQKLAVKNRAQLVAAFAPVFHDEARLGEA